MICDMFHENNLKSNKHKQYRILNIKIMSKCMLELVIRGSRVLVGTEKSGIFPEWYALSDGSSCATTR